MIQSGNLSRLCLGVITTVAALTACGGGGSGAPPPPPPPPGAQSPSRFIYASAFTPGTPAGGIYAYRFDPTSSKLTAVAGSPFATDLGGVPFVMSRDAKFLYALTPSPTGTSVAAFGIQADGSLLSVPGAPFATSYTGFLVAHPTADFLYVFHYGVNPDIYTINSTTGALTLRSAGVPITPMSTVVITPDGKYLYGFTQDEIFEYSIDPASGALTPLAGSPLQTGIQPSVWDPGALMTDTAGRYIYVGNTLFDLNNGGYTGFGGRVYGWSIDPQTAALSRIPASPFTITPGPQRSMVLDASGKYAVITPMITSDTGPNCLAVESIDETSGALNPVPGSPFPGTSVNGECGALLADPGGHYIYEGEGGVSVYSLDETTGVPLFVTGATLAGMYVGVLAVTH